MIPYVPRRTAFSLDALSVKPNGWWNIARRDFADYAGPLIRINRPVVDAATLDVYALADGWLDLAAIAAFCAGGATGRLQILYDQSGNGRNLTNPSAFGTGAQIYESGVQVTLNTKPAADFQLAPHYTRADACGLTGATAYTAVQVCDADAYSTLNRAFVFQREAAGSGFSVALVYESATSMSLRYGGPIQTYGSGIASGTAQTPHWAIRSLAAGAQIGTGSLEVSGQAPVETAETSPTVTLSLLDQRTVVGAGWAAGVGSFAFDGRITACGLWGSILSAGDLTTLRASLNGLIV